MVSRIEHDVVVDVDSIFDRDEFIVGCTDLDFAGVPFVSVADQDKVVAFGLVDSVDRDLERFIDLFDEDPHLGGHPSANGLRGLHDLDERSVLFNVRTPPVARFGILVDFDDSTEQFVFCGVDTDLYRHAFADEADARLIDLCLDLHPSWIGEQKDGLLFADQRTGFDDEVTATATGAFVGVDDLSIGWGFDRTRLDLVLDFIELGFFFDQGVSVRFEFGSGRFDIGIVLDEHFGSGQFVENLQSGLGRFERAFCVLDGELLGFDLQRLQGTFCGEPFGAFKGEVCFAERLLSHRDFADDLLAFGEEGAVEVFLASDDRLVDGGFGTDHSRFGRTNDDALVLGLLFEGRGIELAEGFPFFDQGAFGDHREDWGTATATAFDFAFDFVVARGFDFALFQDDMVKGTFGDRMEHRFRGALEVATWPVHRPVVATSGESRDRQKR